MTRTLACAALLLMSIPGPARAEGAAGLAFGAAAVHVASAEHELRPLVGLWGRLGFGRGGFAEVEASGTRRIEDGGVVQVDERWARGALTVGCRTGPRALEVAVAVGPALTYRDTVVVGEDRWRATALQAGVRYRAGLLLPLGRRWEVDLLFGGASRRRNHDQELVVQGGGRW
ncbi:MAG: hypothetical protein JXB39_04300 [Deltaproteobacteria bacterium]|nr:hypothetical protein [Deltaproteobacteria bacterium]